MKKQIFKKGDRVFDIRYGWGKVVCKDKAILFPIYVQFDDDDDAQEIVFYTSDGKNMPGDKLPLLSFTEYTLHMQGFTQEKPVNYEEYIGKWGKFWSSGKNDMIIARLISHTDNVFEDYSFKSTDSWYKNFEPLTEEQIKILNLE
jgi:hypothetical protein